MRWLIGLGIVAALLVGGDSWVRSYAESTVAGRIERDLAGPGDVEVELGGFPFVVGLLTGDVPNATVTAQDVRRGGLRLDRLTIEARGLEVSIAAVDRRTGVATVEEGSGTAVVSLDVLARFIARRGDLERVRIEQEVISARVPALGRRVRAPLRLEGGRIVIGTPAIEDIIVPLPAAFSGIRYETIEISETSARLTFRMRNVALRSF